LNARSAIVDARAARRRFERAASTYAQASRLEAEAGERMLERLEYLKIAPKRILDAGAGPSREARRLRERYGGAFVVAVDYSLAMLRLAPRGLFGLRKETLPVCGNLARLPFAEGSFDFIWCNMALHWVADPPAALAEFFRVLAPGGLLLFSTLGPDSLKELREAAGSRRVHDFADMHDLGDQLVGAGLASPVMEMEMLSVSYSDAARLLEDLRAAGQTSARPDRPRGLTGKGFGRRLRDAMSRHKAATYELVYGHAWKPQAAARERGPSVVRFHPRTLR
jgi:malonyl-CoA O-methyltransferase